MPSPVNLFVDTPDSVGEHGQPVQQPRTFYVLYNDGSIREYMRADRNRGGTGEWRELAPADEYAD